MLGLWCINVCVKQVNAACVKHFEHFVGFKKCYVNAVRLAVTAESNF